MTLVRTVARPLLASVFLFGGYNQLKNTGYLAQPTKKFLDKARPVLDKTPLASLLDDPELAVRANAAVMLAGGAALATGVLPRPAAAALAASLVPTTVAGHPFWEMDDPQERQQHQIEFVANTSLLGGLLLAMVDTEGKPGLAYRAGMAQDSVGRLTRAAKREAKIAELQAKNALG
ncbi:DoxX family protein [Actinomycetota bacterium]